MFLCRADFSCLVRILCCSTMFMLFLIHKFIPRLARCFPDILTERGQGDLQAGMVITRGAALDLDKEKAPRLPAKRKDVSKLDKYTKETKQKCGF